MKSILLQAPSSSFQAPQLILIGGMLIVFYFFMIRPQQKKQKEQKKFRETIKTGDDVVTIGGLHGKVVQVNEETIVLDVDRGVKLTFGKDSISQEASLRAAKKTA